MVKKAPIGYDLNDVIKVVNIFLIIFMWMSLSINGINKYININSIRLGTLLSIEVIIFLIFEKKKRDPLLLILCIQLTIYYVFRVFTLSLYPYSVVLNRNPFIPSQLNYSIIYIIGANLAIFLGLRLNTSKNNDLLFASQKLIPNNFYLVVFLLLFGYMMNFYNSIGLSAIERIIGVLNTLFINIFIIMMMIIVYVTVYKDRLAIRSRNIIIFGLVLFVIASTLVGSRSAIIVLIYLFLFSTLGIKNNVKIKKEFLLIGVILTPLLIFIFTITTYLRPRLENRSTISSETIQVIKDYDIELITDNEWEVVLSPIFDRIGFLDYSTELIANQEKYKEVFNLKFYTQSIVDNVLTPGFDVFDTPRASNSLKFIYEELGKPNKSRVSKMYQSDEFTIFGEFYVLMYKWVSLIPLFLISFIFKRIYVRIAIGNEFLYYVKRTLVLYVFYVMINSFGIDWLISDIIGVVFTYFIFKGFFTFKKLEQSA